MVSVNPDKNDSQKIRQLIEHKFATNTGKKYQGKKTYDF